VRLADEKTKPTRANILAAFEWLVKGAGRGDRLLLHYSGHGGQLSAASDSAESDGLDETLVPVDYLTAGMIRDGELYDRLVKPLYETGAILRAVLDCCHSGTGMDLRYNLSVTRDISSPETSIAAAPSSPLRELVASLTADAVRAELTRWFGAEAVAARMSVPTDAEQDSEFLEWTADGPLTYLTRLAIEQRRVGARAATAAADVLVVSGCSDGQTSADAAFGSRPNGALTFCALALLRPAAASGNWPTATVFLRDLRRRLHSEGYSQIPQLSSEVPVGGSVRFDLV